MPQTGSSRAKSHFFVVHQPSIELCFDVNVFDAMMRFMRTTLTLDDDVLEQAKALASRLDKPFKTVVNEALRAGLKEVAKPAEQRPYQTRAHAMGLRQGRNLDNIHELLAHVEGEDSK